MATRPVGSLRTREYDVLRAILREKREAAGVSQEALSLRLNRPRTFMGKIEGGTRRLDVVELIQICQSLDIGVSEFVAELAKRIGS